mgnify:CR=1 FL=1
MLRAVSVFLLTCVLASEVVLAEQPLRLMANTSPPYADEKLPERGLAVELVAHVFTGTGVEPVITIENWSRALEGARIGVYDGLATAWYSDERAQDLLFSEAYLNSNLIILKRHSDTRRYTDLRQLAGKRLGIRSDYAYPVDLTAIPGVILVKENHLIQNLLNLINGQVDYVIGDQRTVNQQLHEYLSDRRHQVKVAAIELPQVARHVAVSRSKQGHEQIIADFNAALAKARSDGSHKAIIQRWEQRYAAARK